MKYTEARQGRVFILRLEDGDVLHEIIEDFAREKSISAGTLIAVGGADEGSRLVTGPVKGRQMPVEPITRVLDNVHEIAGVGTLFCDETGDPILHMHTACGREESTVTGCIRTGMKVWQVMEVVLIELIDVSAVRAMDNQTGFKLLKLD
jgi:predicted DNA-binding protein with PD1-like motif